MVTVSEIQVEADFEELAAKKAWYQIAMDLLRKQPLAAAGFAIVAEQQMNVGSLP